MSTEPYEILPPEDRPAERLAFRMADRQNEWFARETPPNGERRGTRRVARILALSFVGATAAIMGWQTSYGHAARETIASLSPNLSWVAPEQTDRIEQITRSVDQMASGMAASHEQLTRTVDRLAANQEQMTREIIKLRVLSQHTSGQSSAQGPTRGQHSRWRALTGF